MAIKRRKVGLLNGFDQAIKKISVLKETKTQEFNNNENESNNDDEISVSSETSPSLFVNKKKKIQESNREKVSGLKIYEIKKNIQEYKSNSFKLKLTQLLKEYEVNYTKLEPLESFIKNLKLLFLKMEAVNITSQKINSYNFIHLVKKKSQKASLDFQFQPPKKCTLVGSYLLKTLIKSNLNVDIAVEMPESMFHVKDFLNYRYFNKRSIYIAELYLQLRKLFPYCVNEEVFNPVDCNVDNTPLRNNGLNEPLNECDYNSIFRPYFFIQAYNGDIHRPIILIKLLIPRENCDFSGTPTISSYVCSKWSIRLFPVPPSHLFLPNRLYPLSNCVRFIHSSATPDFFKDKLLKNETFKVSEGVKPPTPVYNGAIVEDIKMCYWLVKLDSALRLYKELNQAIRLSKIWFSLVFQKNHSELFSEQIDSPNNDLKLGVLPSWNFVCSLLCSHICLAHKEKLVNSSFFEIFRLVLDLLAATSFDTHKIIYGQLELVPLTPLEKMSELKLFIECENNSSSGNNIFWNNQIHMEELKYEATKAIASLYEKDDPFDDLFISLKDQLLYFKADSFIHIQDLPKRTNIPEKNLIQKSDQDDLEFDNLVKHSKLMIDMSTKAMTKKERLQHMRAINFTLNKILAKYQLESLPHYHMVETLHRLISRALSHRIHSGIPLTIRFTTKPRYKPYGKNHPLDIPLLTWTCHNFKHIKSSNMIGILIALNIKVLDSSNSEEIPRNDCLLSSIIHKGYLNNAVEAPYFQSFWRNTSLRKFLDGTIYHSVLWQSPNDLFQFMGFLPNMSDNQHCTNNSKFVPDITCQILEHIFDQYLSHLFVIKRGYMLDSSEKYTQNNKKQLVIYNSFLGEIQQNLNQYKLPDGTVYPHPLEEFNSLKNYLSELFDLPLPIKDVQLADNNGMFNGTYAALYYPFDREESMIPVKQVIDCVIEFEKSNGWPSTKEAITKMKFALLINVLEHLKEKNFDISINIGCDSEVNIGEPYLDITFLNSKLNIADRGISAIYRVYVFHFHEHIQESVKLCDVDLNIFDICKDKAITKKVIMSIRNLWWKPLFNRFYESMCSRFSCLASTIRLVKTWCSFNLFPLDIFNEFIVNICIKIFQDPSPYSDIPGTAHNGFFRFLHFIITHDWLNAGVYVDYYPNTLDSNPNTFSTLHLCRQRCMESFNKVDSTSTFDCDSYFPQTPHFWVSSVADPHCQLIVLPTVNQSKQFIAVGKRSLQLFFSFFLNHKAPKILSHRNVDTSLIHPFHHCIKDSFFLHLFIPDILSRFDAVIDLDVNPSGHYAELLKNYIQNNSDQDKKEAFVNLSSVQRGPKNHITQLDEQQIADIEKKICVMYSKSVLQYQERTSKNTSTSHGKSSFANELAKVFSIYSLSISDIILVFNNLFQKYVRNIRDHIFPLGTPYYNSLHYPYSKVVYLKFSSEDLILNPISPYTTCSVPKVYIEASLEKGDNNEAQTFELNQRPISDKYAYEIPNIPICFSLLYSFGKGLVKNIHLV